MTYEQILLESKKRIQNAQISSSSSFIQGVELGQDNMIKKLKVLRDEYQNKINLLNDVKPLSEKLVLIISSDEKFISELNKIMS